MRRAFVFCLIAFLSLSAFNTTHDSKPKLPGEYVKIPGGTFYPQRDSGKRIRIEEFYMSKFEVTNLQYRTFFAEEAPGMSEAEREKIACDTNGWIHPSRYGEPLKNYYYQHPAYNNHPVVNVSFEGAVKYCAWLQKTLQEANPKLAVEVKLPSREQWIWAARGGRSQAMFPWSNYYLRNKKGEFLCNFKRVGDQSIYRNRKTGKPEVAEWSNDLPDRAFYTAEVKSFYPNDFGLYNMCGNAAEMISEKGVCIGGSWNDYGGDVHILSQANYEGPAPTVGFRPVVIITEKLLE